MLSSEVFPMQCNGLHNSTVGGLHVRVVCRSCSFHERNFCLYYLQVDFEMLLDCVFLQEKTRRDVKRSVLPIGWL